MDRKRRGIVLTAVLALVSVSVGWGTPAGAQSGSVPGVTKKAIKVGAVIGKTNPTGVDYEQVVEGAQARFDAINEKGGILGRKLEIVKVLDDQTRASKSILAARSLVEETEVFAALVATQNFAGAEVFVDAGTPTFGYNIQPEWSDGPNLFGAYGSDLCFDCPSISPVYVAQQVGASRVALFAYGGSAAGPQCIAAQQEAFDKYGPKVVVVDMSLSYGFSANDVAGAVQAIKDNDVDFVAACMDIQGEVNLKKGLADAGVTGVDFYAPQGYDTEILDQLGADLDGFTFPVRFIPFELAKTSTGMTEFVRAMKAEKLEPTENLLVGWVGASLLAEGIRAAGKDFTQASVVDAINQMTAWDANGAITPVNWQHAHAPPSPGDQDCWAYVQADGGKFEPVFGQAGKPLVCFSANPPPADLDDPTYIGG